MAATIVVKPIKPSAVLVESNNKSGTPIHIDDSIDWGKVEGIVADAVSEAVKNVSVDSALSTTSTNAVENRVITAELNSIRDAVGEIDESMYKGVPIVVQTGNATIAPNVLNVWNTALSSLTITKGEPASDVVSNYIVRFIAGANMSVVFSGFNLTWYGGDVPTWTSGKTYEISIVDNLALWAEF